MHIDMLPIGLIQTNCYLVTCSQTGKAVLIDPGWPDDIVMATAENRGAEVIYVLNTHAHWDHIGGNARFVKEFEAQLALHQDDLPLLQAKGGADAWGVPLEASPEPDVLLVPGEFIDVGELKFEILFTPGHTPGHVSLYEANHGALFDGDVLFNRGVGRTDLPGGNGQLLLRSIREVLYTLPDDVMVYPGHGPETSIGSEKQHNPWVFG